MNLEMRSILVSNYFAFKFNLLLTYVTGEKLPERIGQAAELHSLMVMKNIRRTLEGEPLVSFDNARDPFGQACMISLGMSNALWVCSGGAVQVERLLTHP